jgi:DNA gyrase subunit A
MNFVNLAPDEKVAALLATKDFGEDQNIVFCTRRGIIKKTRLSAYGNPRAGGIIAIGIDPNDNLLSAKRTDGHQQIFMATSRGQAIRFVEDDVRPMGRSARGVIGMRLAEDDRVVQMDSLRPGEGTILTVTEKGYAKRTEVEEYRLQGRGGTGIINLRVTDKTGPVVQAMQVGTGDQVMVITAYGKIIRTRVDHISLLGRPTQGVRLIHLDDGDSVVAVARVAEPEEGTDEGSAEPAGRTPAGGNGKDAQPPDEQA